MVVEQWITKSRIITTSVCSECVLVT